MSRLKVYLDTMAGCQDSKGMASAGDCQRKILREIISCFLPSSLSGKHCLVKPNLLKAGEPLCVTSPEIILETAILLKELGARVTVADSPAFGTAEKVLTSLGILNDLKRLGIVTRSLGIPEKTLLPCGLRIGISRLALEADMTINIPRLKVHCQMGMTAAVKNCFGTVTGFRKALTHSLYGHRPELFTQIILEICQLIHPCLNIVDATTMMHVTGPTGGIPCHLDIIGASDSAVAVDTAFYTLLGLKPERIPLWQAATKARLPGSIEGELEFVKDIPIMPGIQEKVVIPERLEPIVFNPYRYIKGRLKSLFHRLV